MHVVMMLEAAGMSALLGAVIDSSLQFAVNVCTELILKQKPSSKTPLCHMQQLLLNKGCVANVHA